MAGFRKAKPQQSALKIGIFGPAGSGKTFTTLLIAEGLAKHTGKKIAYVDTEHGTDFYAMKVGDRPVHPEAFDFEALYTRSLTEADKAIRSLDFKEFGVIVLDSMTHFWEAARASYTGPKGAGGQIPIHAWGRIKKPYKDLEHFLLNSPFHVIICGRQGVIFGKDEDTGELEAQGYRMKAEGETPYEPHILLRMFTQPSKAGAASYHCLAEKDRSGTLAGRIIDWPKFENIAAPILKVLGSEQAQVQTADEAEILDREALKEADEERQRWSKECLRRFKAQFDLAETGEAVEAVNKKLTPSLKKKMVNADLDELREHYRESAKRVEHATVDYTVVPDLPAEGEAPTGMSDLEFRLENALRQKADNDLDQLDIMRTEFVNQYGKVADIPEDRLADLVEMIEKEVSA